MKVLVAGSCPNALVAALFARRAGHSVEVLQGQFFGGVSSLLPASPLAPEVAEALGLGMTLEIVGRRGVSPEGKTVELSLRHISGDVSKRDQERWKPFVQVLNNASELWRGLFALSPYCVLDRWREFGRRQAMEVLRLPGQSLSELLDDWFESDLLKATLGVAALKGARQGPFAPGSAFLLLQRWARGEVFGRARTQPDVLKTLAQKSGIGFREDSLDAYHLSEGKVLSARTLKEDQLKADFFLTAEDPVVTLSRRVGARWVDPERWERSTHWDTRSTTVVAQLEATEEWGDAMVSFCHDLPSLEKAYDPTKYGGYSNLPFAELEAKSGYLYLQHLDGEQGKKSLRNFSVRYGLAQPTEVLTPGEIAERYSVAGGHLYGGERTLCQSYGLRDLLRRPLPNLVLCGASTGPGDYSGVSGAMGAQLIE